MTDKATPAVLGLGEGLGPLVEAAGMVNVLNHGSGSCVYSEGCHGVTQEHLERFAKLVRATQAAAMMREELAQLGYTFKDGQMFPPEDPAQWNRLVDVALRSPAHASAPVLPRPLTEAQLVACITEAGCHGGAMRMSYGYGPYEITRPTINAVELCRAIERAHGIGPNVAGNRLAEGKSG